MMENFALIALVGELREMTLGMSIRRIVQHPGRLFSFETRSGRMPGLRLSLDPRTPSIRVPGPTAAQETVTDDFVMVLRKHLVGGRLIEIHKQLSERIVELRFRTALPTESLREVTLAAELIRNSPNLILLDAARRVLATALPPPKHRGIVLYDEYAYPQTLKLALDTVLGEDTTWFDADAFRADPVDWLMRSLAGVGPVLAAEITARAPDWSATPDGIAAGIRGLVTQISEPTSTGWVYTRRPLSVIVEEGDSEALRSAVISPIELASMRSTFSYQSFLGMMAAVQAVSDPLESAMLLERARSRELRRLKRETNKLELQRKRLLERKQRFQDASRLQTTAQLLASSGADMDRHHESVAVTEYTAEGATVRAVELDATRTLRENVNRMFKRQQKAGRGLAMVDRQLASLEADRDKLEREKQHLKSIAHWDGWLAARGGAGGAPRGRSAKPPAQRRPRRRTVSLGGRDVFVGRNSRENDELTFRVATGNDFWLHVADYSGSHVIVRNPTGDTELDTPVLVQAAQLAAFHSQARNSSKVEVHYTQRKHVGKPKKAAPGLVRLRQFKTITVEPRDWSRPEPSAETVES